MIIFEYCAIILIVFGCVCLSSLIIGLMVHKVLVWRENRAARSRQPYFSPEIQARAAMVWDQYLTHIQPKHHYEFIRYVSHGELHGGGSFERAIQTDKMYMAAISAAQSQLNVNMGRV